MRAAGPPRLANPPSPTDRRIRLHRGLLQPPTPPLDPGLRQPRHLRAPTHLTSTSRIATVSTKPGQLHTRHTTATGSWWAMAIWALRRRDLDPPFSGGCPQDLVLHGQLADLAFGLLERPVIGRP